MEKQIFPADDKKAAALKIANELYSLFDNDLNSRVYLTTNEVLSRYEHYFNDRQKMLSVIASSEQIFSAILAGVEEIDAFDISRFPKYFLYLKKAAIQGLTIEEYLNFFYFKIDSATTIAESKCYHLYLDKIRPHMDFEGLDFWDYLFSNFLWEKIRLCLCRTIYVSPEFQKENNKFLNSKYYHELRDRFKDVSISMKTGNILDLAPTYQDEYDVIYLSNIHTYIGIWRLKQLTQTLKTTKDGVMILGIVDGNMSRHSVGNFDFRLLNGQPYKFTRHDGYITAKMKR